jgi:hypothetical protein
MPQKTGSSESSMTAEHAMNVVLEAERTARLDIEICRADAEKVLQAARQKAQRIAERVDVRITRIHLRCSRAVTDQVGELQQVQRQQAEHGHSYDVDANAVDVVVEQIADMLTTTDEEYDKAAN